MGQARGFAAAHRRINYLCWHGLRSHVLQTSGSARATRRRALQPCVRGLDWAALKLNQKTTYGLNRKFITSPSFTTYSLPSARILPASLAPCSPLKAM